MTIWRVDNATQYGGEICSPWQANHAYSLGARCVCTVAYGTAAARAFVYEVTTAGTSHATTQPTWPTTVGNTVSDGGVTWTCRSPGDGTWDNASCIPWYITEHAMAAGDTCYINKDTNYSTSTAFNLTGSTTNASPKKLICVNKTDDTLSSGAIIAYTGASNANVYRSLYCYGIDFRYGKLLLNSNSDGYWTIWENCNLKLTGTSDAFFGSNRDFIRWINCTLDANGYYVGLQGGIVFEWLGGSVTSAGTNNKLFTSFTGPGQNIRVSGVDLSAHDSALFTDLSRGGYSLLFERCKLNASTTSLIASVSGPGALARMHHCDNNNTVYRFREESYEGTVENENTIVRTGGASDGTTSQSIKMASSANVTDNYIPLVSPPVHAWTDSITEKTFTVEGIWDSPTNIQDDEIWIELEYPANNTDGLGNIARDKCAILGTPADQTASLETWITTGLTNPNRFKLSVTVSPGKVGPITARVCLAKASTTVYIDPLITES